MANLGLKGAILGMSLALNCVPENVPENKPTEQEVLSQRICDERASYKREVMLLVIAAVKPEERDRFQELPNLIAAKVRQQCEAEQGISSH